MRLFGLPADQELLQSFLQLLYNSFFLPESMDSDSITQTIEVTLDNQFLTIDNVLFEVCSLQAGELTAFQNIIVNIEKINCDILFFFDYLIVDDNFTLIQLLHVYITISIEYQAVLKLLFLHQRPLLSESGKELIRYKSWRRLHEVDFDLTYAIAETPIFEGFFKKFINLVSPTNTV